MLDLLITEAAKACVLFAIALASVLLMRRRSAASRHLVWTAAVCGVLLLPIASALLPSLEIEVPVEAAAVAVAPPIASQTLRIEDARQARVQTPTTERVAASGPVSDPPLQAYESPLRVSDGPLPATTRDWPTILLGIWIGGVLLGLGRIVVGVARLRWLQSSADQIIAGPLFDRSAVLARRLGLRRPPLLLTGDDREIPMTWGVTRPIVLLPVGADLWEPWRLDAVLTHELGHIARRDYLAQVAAHIACALHWFNPLAWIAATRMRIEREHACDDLVVRQGHEPSSYAHELVELARSFNRTPVAATIGVCLARPNRLRDRLIALMDETRDRRPLKRETTLKVGSLGLVLALPLAALAAVPVARQATADTDVPAGQQAAFVPASSDASRSEDPASTETETSQLPSVLVPSTVDPVALEWTPIRRPMLPRQQARVLCNPSDGESENQIHSRSNDIITITMEYGGCRSEVRVEGDIEFSDDFSSVSRLTGGSLLRFDVRRPGSRHRLEIEPGAGGRPEYDWSIGGDDQPFDAAAERWLADVLLDFFRSTSYKSAERAAWMIQQAGPEGLLAEVEMMWSGHAQSRYLTVLLADESLTQGQVRRAIEVAGREVESDHALGEVLQAAAANHPFDSETRGTFIAAAGSIESDHTQGQVFATALGRGDLNQENLEALLESATTGIESDHQMTEILLGLVEKYSLDEGLRDPFLRAAATLESDHNQGEVYETLLAQTGLGTRELAAVLAASTTIDSDHTLSQVLISATQHDLGDATLREAFLRSASSIESDHNLGEVLSAAMDLQGLTDADLASILSSASAIESDHTLSSLLLEVADRRPNGSALRSAYLETARSLGGDHDLNRALEAFVALDLDDSQLISTLEVARLIESDHNLSSLLIEIGERYTIEGAVREAFMRALDEVQSEHSHDRVAETIGGR